MPLIIFLLCLLSCTGITTITDYHRVTLSKELTECIIKKVPPIKNVISGGNGNKYIIIEGKHYKVGDVHFQQCLKKWGCHKCYLNN
ncbi:MAG: hypothetical protein OXM55_03590 [Bdellovibrionales bacterium]|nr:hypothetical protein [Bdellovibrionales bacterium]